MPEKRKIVGVFFNCSRFSFNYAIFVAQYVIHTIWMSEKVSKPFTEFGAIDTL